MLENFDDNVVTAGTGGMAAGIAIGNYLTGSKLKSVFRYHCLIMSETGCQYFKCLGMSYAVNCLGESIRYQYLPPIHHLNI